MRTGDPQLLCANRSTSQPFLLPPSSVLLFLDRPWFRTHDWFKHQRYSAKRILMRQLPISVTSIFQWRYFLISINSLLNHVRFRFAGLLVLISRGTCSVFRFEVLSNEIGKEIVRKKDRPCFIFPFFFLFQEINAPEKIFCLLKISLRLV